MMESHVTNFGHEFVPKI